MGQTAGALRRIDAVFGGRSVAGLTDEQLLERFAARRAEAASATAAAEAAFAALVARHGPMVLGVCRRALDDPNDVDDAFQATFLVLVRRAGSFRVDGSLGRWLYGVSCRVAARARGDIARRRLREGGTLAEEPTSRRATGADEAGLRAILDEELRRLPEKYRTPIVLCHLEGLSHAEAARQLDWPVGTLSGRLSRGCGLLRDRLARRGLAPALLLGPVLAAERASAAVPGGLAEATARAVLGSVAGDAGAVSASAAAWARAAGRIGMATHLKMAAAAILALGALTTGAAVLAQQGPGRDQGTPAQADSSAKAPDQDAARPATEADLAPVARKVWAITDAVLKNHMEPPTRREMILSGVRALLNSAKRAEPDDLARRVAAIENADQLATLLRDVWPEGPKPGNRDETLIEGVFAGIPGGSDFLRPNDLKVAEQFSGNRYVGVGLQLSGDKEAGLVKVMAPLRRGPAIRAGMKSGDLILEVNGQDATKADVRTVTDWIRGEPGTPVTIVVRRPGSDERHTLKMDRGVIPFPSFYGYQRVGEDDWRYRINPSAPIGYLWAASIKSSSLHELRQAEARMRAEGIRAVVLDFRESSAGHGGNLHHAALVADALIDGGTLWRVRDAKSGRVEEARADRECLFRGWPMVVLINGVADRVQAAVVAALQDNGRAVLVGEPTQVDGYVSRLVDLADGQGTIRVRTGLLERAASGRGWPVRPDELVASTKAQMQALDAWLRSKNFPEGNDGADVPAPDDPQLARAVEVLRSALRKAEDRAAQP
jgi:C-terminal peptidase prc